MFNNLQSLIGNQAFDDLCEKFAEEAVYGHAGMFPNAITGWTQQAKHGVAGPSLQGIKPGDLVYFSPNEGNGYNGHTGIYQGNNQFLSATDNGVQLNDLGAWTKSTGQQILGYVPTSNPQLKQQLSTLHGGSSTGNNVLADQNAAIGIDNAQTQQQQQQAAEAKWQESYQGAEQASQWFQQYQQQQQQQEMPQTPRQANTYVPTTPGMSAQPTGAEQWLRQYTG